ncbi:hypothetical protein ACLMJK_009122 [Lecanora helva]
MASPSESLPSRTKEEQPNPNTSTAPEKAESGEPSKNALKKAAKEKEKAEKAAKREQKEREEREAREKADAANDTAKHLYGDPPSEPFSLSSLSQSPKWTEDQEITIRTRVQTTRSQAASTCFLILSEGFHTIQAVAAEGGGQGVSRQMIKWCKKLNSESLVQVTGLVKKAELQSPTIKDYELHVKSIYMISEAEEKLPIQTKDCRRPPPAGDEESEFDSQGNPNVSLKSRLDNRVLSARTPASQAIFKLSSGVRSLFVEYMSQHGGTWFEPSYLAGASTEGGADVFEVKYFERRAYLTQSPQFYKQMAVAGDLGLVYTTGPVFRAENSNTKRHLTEFTGLDFEMPIQNHYHEVLTFGENLVTFIIRQLQERPQYRALTDILREEGYPEAGNFKLPAEGQPAVRITFAEGKRLLKESGYDIGEDEEADFDTSQEKALGALIAASHSTDFYTIDLYPRPLRPFYTHPSPTFPHLTHSYDFFMRGQEIMSGAQRIHSHPMLVEEMKRKGLDPQAEGFRAYVDSFRYGVSPHGGGGVGLNRVVMLFLGLRDVREATMFPRDPGRLGP